VIAEAIFEAAVVPGVTGWRCQAASERPYDFLFSKGPSSARVQVKLQRLERGLPKAAPRPYPPGMFVVEVQRTRGGKDRRTGKQTRPYSFGEFDILAVNLHPSTGRWEDFRFTLAAWLVPRPEDKHLISIMQPVPAAADPHWTADLNECLKWHREGRTGRIFTPPKKVSGPRPRPRRERRNPSGPSRR